MSQPSLEGWGISRVKHSVMVQKPCLPEGVELHDYQKKAIENWASFGYRGVFDMATGTGKTYTGLGAMVRLFEDQNRLAAVVVCPYQHLVEQWAEDIRRFRIKPVIGYGASAQKRWRERLKNQILDFHLGIRKVFCFVTTNATFATAFVQEQLKNIDSELLLLADEAHNLGSEQLSRMLHEAVPYRLALSATLERFRDPAGTELLYQYFGKKCIEYGLAQAIREKKLTPYYYYPRPVCLTEEELEGYRDLSEKIVRQYRGMNNGVMEITDLGKKFLIERSRIVAGASGKMKLLKELMSPYQEDAHILVYCGATREYRLSEDERDIQGERQIVAVSKMLGKELGMKVVHFTSRESREERRRIIEGFQNGDPYQAIIAIKCLDEGVNIPGIKTAFLLASSANPKEYIQRRGRVLRKAPGKHFAVIYDFVTLPGSLEKRRNRAEISQAELTLVKKEILRIQEFGELSENPSEADRLVKRIVSAYGLDQMGGGPDIHERTFG